MEGTISLGIYDRTGRLLRTLHRAAQPAEFGAALDGFITRWDGRDDAGQPLPAGTYRGKGYLVGPLTVRREPAPPALSGTETLEQAAPQLLLPGGKPFLPQKMLKLVLVGNPLEQDRSGGAEVSVGFDATGSWLQLSSGLPLKRISTTPHLKWAALARESSDTLTLFQSDGATIEHYTVGKVSHMMAFDCGDFTYDPAQPGK